MERQFVLSLLVTGILALPAFAEAGERKERAEAFHREAAELAEQGRHEKAERLEQKARTLLDQGERPGDGDRPHQELDAAINERQKHLHNLRREAERLREAGASEAERIEVEEQVGRVERGLDKLVAKRNTRIAHPPHDRHAPPHHEEQMWSAMERVEHLLIAAEHLDRAGVHDLARNVRREAEHMERKVRDARHRAEEDRHPKHPQGETHLVGQMKELRHELRRLREELNEVREHLGDR